MKGAFAFVTNWFEFLLLRILERNGKAIRNPPRDALIVESLTKKETRKGFAIHRILDTLGAIFGSLIAAILIVLLSLNVQTTIELSKFLFVVSMFFGLISVLIVIFFVKEGKMKRKGERLTFAFNERAKSFLIFSALIYIGLPLMAIFYLRAVEVGLIVSDLFLSCFLYNLMYIIGAAVCGRLKFKSKDILVASTALIAISLASIAISSPSAFLVSFGIFGLSFGIFEVETRNYISEIAEKGKEASLYGAHRTLTGISILLCGLLMGLLWDYIGGMTFLVAAAIAALSTAFLIKS
jgi:MFS family permease